jgi:hypothetical protein
MSRSEAPNETGDDAHERRREPRRRVFLKGKLVYVNNSYSADCTIKDLSPGGARITVAPEAVSTDPFLIIVKHAVVYESRTAWHTGAQAGLQFIKAIELGGATPLHLRAIQRVWVELMPR